MQQSFTVYIEKLYNVTKYLKLALNKSCDWSCPKVCNINVSETLYYIIGPILCFFQSAFYANWVAVLYIGQYRCHCTKNSDYIT
jgi:hypothetical protein